MGEIRYKVVSKKIRSFNTAIKVGDVLFCNDGFYLSKHGIEIGLPLTVLKDFPELFEKIEKRSKLEIAREFDISDSNMKIMDRRRITKKIQLYEEAIKELQAWIEVDEKLLIERNRLLDVIPECEDHGKQCIPHAIEYIEKLQENKISKEQAEKMIATIKCYDRFINCCETIIAWQEKGWVEE